MFLLVRKVILPALVVFLGAVTSVDAQELIISELMAVNNGTIEDEDGNTPDWVEIFNAGDTAQNLSGYFLTDDPLVPEKWRFPSVSIAPGGFLLVFASDKDRRVAGSELHANFKLSSSGEFLGLIAPDGETIVDQVAPFPALIAGFSYGISQNARQIGLVGSEVSARALVPTNGNLGMSWMEPGFDDSGWLSGATGVGYDRNATYRGLINLDVEDQMRGENLACFIRIPFSLEDGVSVSGLLLRMKYDDGFIAFINGQRIAGANAPDGNGSWNIGATSLHDDGEAVEFEDFTVAGGANFLRDGENILAIIGLNDNLGSSDFMILPELVGFDAGEANPDEMLYFPQPTPGSANLPGVNGITLPPTVTPSSGVISGNTQMVISSDSPTAVIRYTRDGSLPTSASTRYSGPVSINSSTRIRARVFEPDGSVSPTVSRSYIMLASNVRDFSSTLPVVVIDSFGGGGVPSNSFEGAFMAIYEPVGGRTSFTNEATLANAIGIKTRGSSTGGRDKASYGLEFWDENNEDRDLAPLGMPEESDWVLYGAYNFDRAHLRNPLIYELSRQSGRWAARTRFCEVYFNTGGGTLSSSHYRGIYSFMEKIKRGEDRVDIRELSSGHTSEPEITGGYMLKIDRADPGDGGFSAAGRSIRWVEPKEDDVPSVQATWIRNYFNDFGNALNGANFRDPVRGYAPYIDKLSWADHHMLNVLAKNVDALRLSTYFYKDRNGPIEFGPIWDFDRSMNSTDGRDDNPRTWNGTGDGTDFFNYPWWGRLFDDPDFMQLYRDRWHELRQGPLSSNNIQNVIDSMADEIREAQPRDSSKWGRISASGWRTEISNLRSWLTTRAGWMDSQFRLPPTFTPAPGPVTPGFQFTLRGSGGSIYYTLDGSDPRAPGGSTSASATRYSQAVSLTETARVVARVRVSSTDWSPPVAGTFYTELPGIVISEFMFHPESPPAGSEFSDEDFEFIELLNAGNEPLPLAGIRLKGGIDFTFPDTGNPVLGPGEYVLVVNNVEAFASRYNLDLVFVAGEFTGRLENAGEELILEGALGEPIHQFTYSDSWYADTDGGGLSLVIRDPLGDPGQWAVQPGWDGSTVLGGSPGFSDEGFPALGGRQRPGDSNQDGVIDISDGFSMVSRLFAADNAPLPCEGPMQAGGNLAVLDVNEDTNFDLSDAIHLLAYMFQGGPAPALGEQCVRLKGCNNNCSR